MNNKISMGYGGVEFSETEGFNIITKKTPLKSEEGLVVEEVPCEAVKMENLALMYKFLDEVLFERLYVEPVSGGTEGEISSINFLVNSKFYLNVITVVDGGMYPALLSDDKRILKFSYEGKQLERFFDEIRKDVKDVLSR